MRRGRDCVRTYAARCSAYARARNRAALEGRVLQELPRLCKLPARCRSPRARGPRAYRPGIATALSLCATAPIVHLPGPSGRSERPQLIGHAGMKHEPHPKKKPLTAQTLSNERTQSCTSTWRLRGLRGSDVDSTPSAFPLYCLLFHMCPEARQSTNTIHGGII